LPRVSISRLRCERDFKVFTHTRGLVLPNGHHRYHLGVGIIPTARPTPRTVELTCGSKWGFRHNLRQILQTAGVPVVDMRESDANLTVLN
jgi:hypothetical protein